MTESVGLVFDTRFDLVLERTIPVPRERVWDAWTQPEHLKHWFCPRPWVVSHCEIDLRPGGAFNTTMRSPEGVEHPNPGCCLEAVPLERLVITDCLLAGYRPSGKSFMTAVITLEPVGAGSTKYTARVFHPDEATRKKHEEMGFHDGWSTALEQLVAYIQST